MVASGHMSKGGESMSGLDNGGYSDDQQKKLDEAVAVVSKQAALMRRCLETHKLMDGLKHCSAMLSELRSSSLTPKNYYELYMAIFDNLRHMTNYLADAHIQGLHDLSDLYELVQYAGNIIPRLYLMITVGSVYMGMPGAPVKEIMRDMMEMTRGVQHPTRGLFLRHYLSGMTKDHLPVGDSEGPQGNLQDSIDFSLANFVEMNKLWVRLQHQGRSRDRERRISERKDLRTLVGSNLVRLSQLEGIGLEIYSNQILPELLDQIVNCKDLIAQEYLMEAIIQVFQDDFHLRTLDRFLASIANLNPKLSTKNIIIAFIDRLSSYASREAENSSEEGEVRRGIPDDVPLFDTLWNKVKSLIGQRKELLFEDATALLLSSAKLALSCYPDRLDYIDQVLAYAQTSFEEFTQGTEARSATTTSNLLALLQAPIDQYSDPHHNPLTLLNIKHYAPLFHLQPPSTRRALANKIINAILKREQPALFLDTTDHVQGVLDLLSTLIRPDPEDQIAPSYKSSRSNPKHQSLEDNSELASVAKVLTRIRNEDRTIMQELLQTAFKSVATGENRVVITLPPLISATLKLCRSYALSGEGQSDDIPQLLRFLNTIITRLYEKAEAHNPVFRYFLSASLAADELGLENQAYEFFVQAFLYYEECISESKEQVEAIHLLIGTLQTTRIFGESNYDALATKCTLHSGKLLKKPDQVRAICQTSRLFWILPTPSSMDPPLLTTRRDNLYRDGGRALDTLQRALKIADGVMDPLLHFELFVEILNQYIHLFQVGCPTINAKYINGLLELIKTHLENLNTTHANSNSLNFNDPISHHHSPGGGLNAPNLAPQPPITRDSVAQYFDRTLDYIRQLKLNPPTVSEEIDDSLIERSDWDQLVID